MRQIRALHPPPFSEFSSTFDFSDTPQAKQPRPAASTYSDHIAMEEGIRTEFFAKIEEAIQKHGGEIRLCDTIDLELARKP